MRKPIITSKAIQTTYHGPTYTRGARIHATDHDGNRVSIPYPYELNSDEAHLAAAQKLCDKMNWKGQLAGGYLKKGCVFVFVDGLTIGGAK